jgi:unsaturated rhamnogalacturonyl hydrolase
MIRRSFLALSGRCLALGGLMPRDARAAMLPARHHPAATVTAPLDDMAPFNRRASFGWRVGGVPPVKEGGEMTLRWRGERPAGDLPARLRVCVLDTREPRTPLEVRVADSPRVVGTFDLQWVGQFQVHEIPLTAADAAAAWAAGVTLRQTGGTLPVWIVTGTGAGPELPAALHPHLLFETPTDPPAEFFTRLNSLASVQPFGWMEGCVLDGLRDLAALPAHASARAALRQHLALWFKEDGRLIYENPRGEPVDDRSDGVESTLPFAALAWEQPDHPALEIAADFFMKEATRDPEGGVSLSSEGTYTVGYPFAVLARVRGDSGLAEQALRQVMIRQERLFDGKVLSRTSTRKDAGRFSLGNRNWCRGIAWQFLGLSRTLTALDGMIDLQPAIREAGRLAEWILPSQLPGGLWSVFVDEPRLAPDTSGSAGIAAALAICANHGWAGPEARAAARRCLEGLRPHLTPDGFLGGVSQSNKGGEGLQRGNYRVIYQMGMGLKAQLIAALEAGPA